MGGVWRAGRERRRPRGFVGQTDEQGGHNMEQAFLDPRRKIDLFRGSY